MGWPDMPEVDETNYQGNCESGSGTRASAVRAGTRSGAESNYSVRVIIGSDIDIFSYRLPTARFAIMGGARFRQGPTADAKSTTVPRNEL